MTRPSPVFIVSLKVLAVFAFGLLLFSGVAKAADPGLFESDQLGWLIGQTCSDGASCSALALEAQEWRSANGDFCSGSAAGAAIVAGPINGPEVFGGGWRIWQNISCGDGSSIISFIFLATNCPAPNEGAIPPCPVVVPPCDGSITGKSFLRPVFSGGSTGDICHESSSCVMSAGDITGLAGGDLVEYSGTSQDCASEPMESVPPEAEGPNCISSGGDSWCAEPDLGDQNCGFLNDDYICLGSIPPGECTFFGNGSVACDSAAGSPPAPDDGVTVGTPAPPDTTINNNGGTTNIYTPGTVGTSSGASGGTDQPDGPADSQEPGTGSGTASGDCSVPPVCTGDSIQCAILTQEFHSACQEPGTEATILATTGLTGLDDVDGQLGSSIGIDSSLDGSGFLGVRECLVDIPMDLGFFGAHTIPLSQWCPLFAFIGLLVLASAGITSLKIISGAF